MLAAAVMGYVFLYLPLAVVVLFSFNAAPTSTDFTGFSIHWYRVLLHDREMLLAAKNSFLIAAVASLASTFLGTLAAFAMQRWRAWFFSFLLFGPMAVPEVLMGVSLLLFFVLCGFPLGMISIILAHIAFCVSFVAILVASRLMEMDPLLLDAALDLGATPQQAFWRITLPFITPAVAAGFLLAYTLSIDDFVITFFTAGPGASTLPVRIFSIIRLTVTPEVNAISTLLLAVSVTLILFAQRLLPGFFRTSS